MNYTLDKNGLGSLDEVVGELIFEESVKKKFLLHKIIKDNIPSFAISTLASSVNYKVFGPSHFLVTYSLIVALLVPKICYKIFKDTTTYGSPGYFLGALTGQYLSQLYLK